MIQASGFSDGNAEPYIQGPIMELPNEVTLIFLKMLPTFDCAKAAQVCVGWYNLLLSEHTYTVAGGNAEIVDKTWGFVKVNRRGLKNFLRVDEKRVTPPGQCRKFFSFDGSLQFRFEGKGKFIKIIETVEDRSNVYYINPAEDNLTYTLYRQKPNLITDKPADEEKSLVPPN